MNKLLPGIHSSVELFWISSHPSSISPTCPCLSSALPFISHFQMKPAAPLRPMVLETTSIDCMLPGSRFRYTIFTTDSYHILLSNCSGKSTSFWKNTAMSWKGSHWSGTGLCLCTGQRDAGLWRASIGRMCGSRETQIARRNTLLCKRKTWVLFAEEEMDSRPANTVFIYYVSYAIFYPKCN